MRKTVSIILIGLMIIGMMGYIQAVAQEGNDLEELVGLKVKVWYAGGFAGLSWTGILLQIRGSWLILVGCGWWDKGEYTWCYIPTIRGIDILDKDYKPGKEE